MIKDPSNNNGCLSTICRLFGIKPKPGDYTITQTTPENEPRPYRIRDDFLSPAEKSFFHILWFVAGKQTAICTKVNLLDIFFVHRPNENQAYRNRII
jgi:hypothetical protein